MIKQTSYNTKDFIEDKDYLKHISDILKSSKKTDKETLAEIRQVFVLMAIVDFHARLKENLPNG